MSRAAILPTPGDPFILTYWMNKFNNVWAEEVDMLHVCLNSWPTIPKEITDYNMNLLISNPKVDVMYVPRMLYHGKTLRRLVGACEEDLVMFVEDDTVIFKQDQVDKCFRKLERYDADMVGSPRFSCSQEILDASAKKYNLDYTGYGDKGPNFWPNFFFAKLSDIRKTNQHFESKGWAIGEEVKELDFVAKQPIASDTFVWVSMQLRAMGLVTFEIPQYHSHPYDLKHLEEGINIWDGNCSWVHIGSLTMTAEILLTEDRPGALGKIENDMEEKEIERRFAWLQIFVEDTWDQTNSISHIRELYLKRINDIIKRYNLSVKHIEDLKFAYRSLVA